MALLERFYDPDSGAVLVNGKDKGHDLQMIPGPGRAVSVEAHGSP